MDVKIENLHDTDLVAELNHSELIPFIKPYMKVFNPWVIVYWISNLAALTTLIVYAIFTRIEVSEVFANLGLGFFIFLVVLLPMHELLHGLAYKLVGAKKISYKAEFRKMIFYALADKFVASRSEFTFVAITPFIIINSLLVCGFIFMPVGPALICYGALILHIGGCYGDFALISFFYERKGDHLITFDDAAKKKTFFFRYVMPKN